MIRQCQEARDVGKSYQDYYFEKGFFWLHFVLKNSLISLYNNCKVCTVRYINIGTICFFMFLLLGIGGSPGELSEERVDVGEEKEGLENEL